MEDPRKIVGLEIRKRRTSLGLTQEQLAERAELHTTYVSNIEGGRRSVGLVKLVAIATALGVKVRDLVKNL